MLHIYAQAMWHDQAFIVGSKAALEALGKAIARAIESGKSSAQSHTADGEGYVVMVAVHEANDLAEPYTDREFMGKDDGKSPCDLFTGDEYRKLAREPEFSEYGANDA